ncbi:MAG: ROK family protein [Bacteroidales bacterium]|nr:ROK family protein [Bacteroidales bacterium]
MREVALGIDIGGTNTAFGFVDRKGNCLYEDTIVTQTHEDVDLFVKEIYDKVQKSIKKLDDIKLIGIGVGAPNGNFYTGAIEDAPNLRWKGVIPFSDIFKKYFNLPVFLTNDANAAAIGEMIYGGAKGMKNFIVVTLGTGLGSGFVVNGELLYGHDGFAGEMGHIIVTPDGRQCACGRKGCLETYVSATGVKRSVYKLLADNLEESELRNIPFNDLTAKMVADAANRGDKIALKTFEHTGRMLGEVLANTVAITSPEAIFLFGGLAKSGDLIFKPTKYHLEKNLLNIYKNKIKILPSGLDDNAAILGSSALVWKEHDRKS